MKARVTVRLKQAILDPQGKTVLRAARQMGYEEIKSVRIGKIIELEVEPGSADKVKVRIEELSKRLLSNPQMEEFEIQWIESESSD